jgi:hypothetical protein
MELTDQNNTPATETGTETWYPLNMKIYGLLSHSEHIGEEKNLLPLPEFEPRLAQPAA